MLQSIIDAGGRDMGGEHRAQIGLSMSFADHRTNQARLKVDLGR
jgi:hypothetical protein